MSNQRLWVVAHRGGRNLRPENTLAAFWNAIALGVDMIETDVRWSKDKHLVLIHDDTLDRTANIQGFVGDLTVEEIRCLDVGTSFDSKYQNETIPTLEGLFRLAHNRTKVLLDLKGDELYLNQIIDLVSAYRMEFDVVLGVRTMDALSHIRKRNPTIRLLSFGYPIEVAYDILEAGADIIRLWGDWVTPERVEHIRDLGKAVWVMAGQPTEQQGGQTTLDELRWFAGIGVNGVILDDPRLAFRVNSEHSSHEDF